ncbi:unnamed protein product [Rhizophagus irregularis]|nr:unnamed protein product [Rhizophagus irregularis]
MIQDIKQNVDEMYTDWKANGGFGNHAKNDTRWIEDVISQAIYTTIDKVKYPDDERIMQVCYDALLDAENDTFNKKIKQGGWKLKNSHDKHEAILFNARVKDAIHAEFVDLVKPKTENRQVIREEERKFKDAEITRNCYRKLNQPINSNNDPRYTYFKFLTQLLIVHFFTKNGQFFEMIL